MKVVRHDDPLDEGHDFFREFMQTSIHDFQCHRARKRGKALTMVKRLLHYKELPAGKLEALPYVNHKP